MDHSNQEILSDFDSINLRVSYLRKWLEEHHLDAFILSYSDCNQNIVYPASLYLYWITGFSGAAGKAIILREKAFLFVDGRYILEAKETLYHSIFTIQNSHEKTLPQWILENIEQGKKIGFDPWMCSIEEAQSYRESIIKKKASLLSTNDPMKKIWINPPTQPKYTIFCHSIKYAGETEKTKINQIIKKIEEKEADYLILTDSTSIAWTFNLRAPLPYTPVFPSFALISREQKPQIFLEKENLLQETIHHLETMGIEILSKELFLDRVQKIATSKKKILLDPESSPEILSIILEQNQAFSIHIPDPTYILRAKKNSKEIKGMRSIHQSESVALIHFLCWINAQKIGTIDEIEAAKTLYAYRTKAAKKFGVSFQGSSFETISAIGKNGAMIHYRTSMKTNCLSYEGALFLIDSGGQYLEGTTDITRTIVFGSPNQEQKKHFTLVLKGLIALSCLSFPSDTRGCDIDALARQALWKYGLDYSHGTGHGVGSFLNVHEGPQKISKTGTEKLIEGMIISNEPGYYKEGHYGIRCENMMLVKEAQKIPGGDLPMYSFETLTLVPFEQKLIDEELLTEEEKIWISAYHQNIIEKIGPFLEEESYQWLLQTAPRKQ